MARTVDHYGAQYKNFLSDLYKEIRSGIFPEDMGQNGWVTTDEQDMFIGLLQIRTSDHLLDVACGSGGPTLRIAKRTGCRVTGIDIHVDGVKTAQEQAGLMGLTDKASFILSDGSSRLPFDDGSLDVVTCIDAINHLPNRPEVLREWHRVLKPGGRVLFTDPITITGVLTKDEIAIRSSIGYFLFSAPGYNAKLMEDLGFTEIKDVDRTRNMAEMARNWVNSREKYADQLREIEGVETYEGQQTFFRVCTELASSGNLSRILHIARKP